MLLKHEMKKVFSDKKFEATKFFEQEKKWDSLVTETEQNINEQSKLINKTKRIFN